VFETGVISFGNLSAEKLMWPFKKSRSHRPFAANKVRPWLEALESRLVPYAVTGDAWIHPELVTLSFVPDGTIIGSATNGYIRSNLFATFNGHSGWSTATWQNQILKAAQAWAQQTNLNLAVVPDNGATMGTGSYQQGDPGFGDIRIAGYNFGNNYLGVADMPMTDNNYSIAGDVTFNTGQPFNIGSTYDLFSVAVHEMGHALGMDHSSSSTAVMYATYTSTRTGLSSDDIAGIRSIYSNGAGRSPDAYDANGSNDSFASADSLTSQIDPTSRTAVVNNLDITTTSEADYYTLTAPAGSNSTLTVRVQSAGLSLLAPTLTVYAADQSTVLGSVSGLRQYGTTLAVTVNGVSAGQQFYVKVAGADTTAFGTGKYALILNLGTGATPTAPAPNTQTADGGTMHSGGGQNEGGTLLGGVFGTINTVVNGLLGTLLGISTKIGIGAGIGDAYAAPDVPASPATVLPKEVGQSAPAATFPTGFRASALSAGQQDIPIPLTAPGSINLAGNISYVCWGVPVSAPTVGRMVNSPHGGSSDGSTGFVPGSQGDETPLASTPAEGPVAFPPTGTIGSLSPTGVRFAPVEGPQAELSWADLISASFAEGRWTPDSSEPQTESVSHSESTDGAQSPAGQLLGAGLAVLLAGSWPARGEGAREPKTGSERAKLQCRQ
jgi:hypothetical protein